MAQNDPSRIKVDLELARNNNMKLLEDFGKQFSDSVGTLNSAMQSYAQQIAGHAAAVTGGGGGGGGHQPGRPSPTASVGSGGPDRPNRQGRGSENASRSGFSFAPGNLNEYEDAALTLGNVGNMNMTNMLQYFSNLAGRHGYDQNMNPTDRAGSGGSRFASNASGLIARSIPYGQSAVAGISTMSHTIGATSGAQSPWMQVGYSGEGLFGSSFGSSAMGKSIGSAISSKWSSFSTANWDGEQDKSLRATLMGYGFDPGDSGRGEAMFNDLKGAASKSGIGGETLSKLLEPTVRYGNKNSLEDATKQIKRMGDAAALAGRNSEQFAQDVLSMSQALTAKTGIGAAAAQKASTQFMATTGLPGEVGTNIVNNDMYMFAAMSQSGGKLNSPSDVAAKPMAATGAMMGMLPGMLGLSPSEMGSEDARDRISWMMRTNPEMFGGMDAQQIAGLYKNDGKFQKRMTAYDDLMGDSRDRSAKSIASTLLSKNEAGKFEEDTEGWSRAHKYEALAEKFKDGKGKLDLTVRAARLVKMVESNDTVYDRNSRNNSAPVNIP